MSKKPERLDEIITILKPSKTVIARIWMEKPSVIEIFARHKISRKKFIPLFAEKVIQYFIDVLDGVKKIGNCPVMNKFIDYMSDKEISVKEIFLICMAFRRSMFDHLIANGQLLTQDTTILEHLSEVFDQNLSGVLDYFARQDITRETQALHEHDQEEYVKSFQTILDIQEHMILTVKKGKVFLANKTFLHAFGASDIKDFNTLFPDNLSFIESVEHEDKSYSPSDHDIWLDKIADSVSQQAIIAFFNLALQRSHPYNAKISRMPSDDEGAFVMTLGEFSECDERISELSRYVYKDAVTNLFNRRKFDESLEMFLGQCRNSDVELSLIIIDLGDLMNIKAMYGRERADEIMKEIGQSIDEEFGHLGVFARTDSDRFGLLLKAYSLEKAVATAQLIQALTKMLKCGLQTAPMSNIAVVNYHKDDSEQTMLSRVDTLIDMIIQDGGNAIKDDQTLVEEEQEQQRLETDFLKACIELKAADTTLDVVNYFQEVPIQSKSNILTIHKSSMTIAMRKIAINALHKDAFVYIQTPPGDKNIKAKVKMIDNDKFTITVDRFLFVASSPLDRKSVHVRVEQPIDCFIKMGDTQIKGVLESLSTDTAMIVLPHIYGISMEGDVLLDVRLRWEKHDEHLQLTGKITKIIKNRELFKVIIRFNRHRVIDDVVTPYIANRQLEIIKTLQRTVF